MEADNVTKRPLVEIVDKEPSAHIAREERRAAAEHRPPVHAYSQLPLTGSSLTLLPAYQLLQNFGKAFRIIDRGEMTPEADARHRRPAPKLEDVCSFRNDGGFEHFTMPNGKMATTEDLIDDAMKWERAFSHDYRWLSDYNHNHACASTCVKKMKKATVEDKRKAVKSNKAPPCRFWFLHIVLLYIWTGTMHVLKKYDAEGKT